MIPRINPEGTILWNDETKRNGHDMALVLIINKSEEWKNYLALFNLNFKKHKETTEKC